MDDALNTSTWRQPNTFMDIVRPAVNNLSVKKSPDHSSTLMRSAVKKPVPAIEDQNTTNNQFSNFKTDLTAAAGLTDKSPLVSRFAPNNTEADSFESPVKAEQYPSMDSAPTQATYEAPSYSPSEATAVALEQPSINIFNKAIETPYDYSQQQLKKTTKSSLLKRISGWSVVGIVAVGVIAGGVLVNRNLGRVELYMASSRAGFSATLPSVKPTGYDLSSISTGSGVIEASYKSNSDARNYTINEKSSSSANDLLTGYLQNKVGLNYQTVTTASNTIYIYGSHDATWVSGKIWYIVQDNNALSDHQIIDLANSM